MNKLNHDHFAEVANLVITLLHFKTKREKIYAFAPGGIIHKGDGEEMVITKEIGKNRWIRHRQKK